MIISNLKIPIKKLQVNGIKNGNTIFLKKIGLYCRPLEMETFTL